MRAYLSSHGLGPGIEGLCDLAGGRRTAVIANALDHFPSEERARLVEDVIGIEPLFLDAGLKPTIIDLRNWLDGGSFDGFDEEFDIVWLTGGNCFVLARILQQSGFDRYLQDAVRSDRVVYAGWSAGACVAGSTLHGLEGVDDPDILPAGYADTELQENMLGFVEGTVLPHFRSDHSESPLIDRAFDCLIREGRVVTCLQDGQALLMENGATALLTSGETA